ncbi:hypothetical protein ALO42_102928 [Pseudomonas syringae pv. atrofaciens]|uniref:Uncharacterized protein n=2 Tax=Pseudomonas syringae group TaxID=136849 RepID=A0A3M4XPY9_9PSED|nr:hypothetical protein ALO42_102928 [Pseudomonas syringae pv. atrofaciens]KPZ04706.1 hypothetical protein ALO85_102128 [Pseudomonas syringae pv. aptata]RMN66072.1 hypothetical protein ALQ54_101961 [Pseudomonas syringae]RMR78558.1 hypothetical protein ALP78_102549 [Pseudomonas coronafaciens pv. striafaciens]RMO42545.1 hypothetical protein ALQ40_102059 [Pseudomonas syringae]
MSLDQDSKRALSNNCIIEAQLDISQDRRIGLPFVTSI